MEELEDGDQGGCRRRLCEEPVILIRLDGETLAESEADETQGEESHDDVNGGFLDPALVRGPRLEELAGYREMQV